MAWVDARGAVMRMRRQVDRVCEWASTRVGVSEQPCASWAHYGARAGCGGYTRVRETPTRGYDHCVMCANGHIANARAVCRDDIVINTYVWAYIYMY